MVQKLVSEFIELLDYNGYPLKCDELFWSDDEVKSHRITIQLDIEVVIWIFSDRGSNSFMIIFNDAAYGSGVVTADQLLAAVELHNINLFEDES
jgi:hypothetical protein